jgi:hypothetical protein
MSESSALVIPWANDTLCATCREVLRRPVAVTYGEKALRISAARKCGLCTFFFDGILATTFRLSQKAPDLIIERDGSRLRVTDFNEVVHHFELHAAQGLFSRAQCMSPADMERSKDQTNHPITPFRLIQPHVNSEPCWSLIRNWLDNCVNDHGTCRQNSLSGRPTRLFDVESLRLVTHLDSSSSTHYAALSHCWGSTTPLMLTHHTYQDFMRSIYLQAIPQSFQDAIYTAKKLDVRYLWVDSLCIIQDDREDWSREAASMGNYYRNAFVVLSSLSASDGSVGFLRPRNLDSSTRLGSGLRIRRARPSWAHIFENSPLSRRAWVFQERLLSTRIVHFEHNELFWECLEVSAREGSFVEKAGLWNGDDWNPESLKRCLAFDNVINSNSRVSRLQQDLLIRLWYRVLRHYTTLHVTIARDMLNAIAGIAQKFSEATGFTYLAGLWMEDMHSSMLWYCEGLNRITEGSTPSWSWASSTGPKGQLYDLSSQTLDSRHQADVLNMYSVPIHPSGPFGVVRDACIVVDAHYFEAKCQSNTGERSGYGDTYLLQVLNIFSDVGAFIGTGYWDTTPDKVATSCIAMVITQRMDATLGCVTYFLLVEEVPDSPEETCRRIGIGQTADTTYGYATNTLHLSGLSRKRFKLV